MSQEHVKLVIVGNGAVGKTSMLIRYATDKFTDDYIPNVFDNYTAQPIVDGRKISVALWDTAGPEDYDRIRPLSYPNTDCFIVCYSVSNEESLADTENKWWPEIRNHCPKVPFLLVGTKSDLRKDEEFKAKKPTFVDFAHAQKKGIEIGADRVMECSAKTKDGLKDVFDEAVRLVRRVRSTQNKGSCTLL